MGVTWARGGHTNLANLAPLCRYHNRVNDDVPGLSRRGRIVRRQGRIYWRSPRGYPVSNPRGHRGAMDLLFGKRKADNIRGTGADVLVTGNPDVEADTRLLARLGLHGLRTAGAAQPA